MKKVFLIGAFLLSVFGANAAHAAYSQSWHDTNQPYSRYRSERAQPQVSGECPPDAPDGMCYCRYVHYQPRYYTTKRCVEECYTCPKKCCRYVPQYYEVKKCRYVPEYYTETHCRQVPEYYEVQECKTCKKVICEPQCEYVPTYYWKCECK